TRDPDPNPRMLDRFLVIAEANGLPAAVVVNKVELDREVVDVLSHRFGAAGYQVLGTSGKVPEGLPALRDLLRGRETVFTGASGVGKSSLLNALEPGLKLRIGAISEKWRTGKHTTRAAELVPLAVGGYVVGAAGDARGRRVGHRARRAVCLLPGISAAARSMPLRQLPSQGRAGLRGARGGGGGARGPRPPALVRADSRRDQRSFLVHRFASR